MVSPTPRNPLLDEAVEAYFRLVEQGARPDRMAFAANYPDHTEELVQRLSDEEFLHRRQRKTCGAASEDSRNTELYSRSDSPSDLAPPQGINTEPQMQFGGFRLLEELGRGRQGVVYKARQRGTNRIVALKVIREGAFASAAERVRFENEIQVAARLDHPNIIGVHECGQDAGRDYFAMEFVEGVPLDRYCRQQALDARAIVGLFVHVCHAVGYAHEHAVLHRDLKPANVLVDSKGRPHVLDFGLAKSLGDEVFPGSGVTEVGDFAGTWHYASPEQVQRNPALLDVRSDVYSLGVTLYELLTGCLPYPVLNEPRDRMARTILETPPRPARQIVPDLDPDLETIVLRALSKETARRYASGTALAEDLERYLTHEPIEAKRDDTWYVLRRILRRHRLKFAAAAVIVLFLIGSAILMFVLYTRAVAATNAAIEAQKVASTAKDEALEAKKTTELRLTLALDSQTYWVQFVDEIQAVLNGFDAVVNAHPELPAVQRYLKPTDGILTGLLDHFACDLPEGIIDALRVPQGAAYRPAIDWLEVHESSLSELVALLKESMPELKAQGTLDSSGVNRQLPPELEPVYRISEALCARALWKSQLGEHSVAVASLNSARDLACGLGNGRITWMKTPSYDIRSMLYGVVSRILEHAPSDRAIVGLYLNWVQLDPPLPSLKPAVLLEQLGSVNAVQAAARSEGDGSRSYVDVDEINRLTGSNRDELFRMTGATCASGQAVTPQSALAILDQYYREAAQWDSATFQELEERAAMLRERLYPDPAFPVVRMLFHSYLGVQKDRGRCQAARSATMLAAALCGFRAENGYWPEALDELDLEHLRLSARDPYIGQPFGYRLEDGLPVLYSINEDGIDDDGQPGEWGAYGTDVVLFRPVR